MSFQELLHRMEEAIRSGPRVIAEFLDRDGQSHVVTEDGDSNFIAPLPPRAAHRTDE